MAELVVVWRVACWRKMMKALYQTNAGPRTVKDPTVAIGTQAIKFGTMRHKHRWKQPVAKCRATSRPKLETCRAHGAHVCGASDAARIGGMRLPRGGCMIPQGI